VRLNWKLVGATLATAIIAFVSLFWLRPVTVVYLHMALPLMRAYYGAESHSEDIAGVRMHWLALGPTNGLPLVLAHGLGGRGDEWLPLASRLAKAGRRVYLPDLPGYGESEQPQSFSYSPSDEAAALDAFMARVCARQCDLGGISMGGWIVQIEAYKHPERVRRLMVMDSAGLRQPPAWDTRLFTPQTTDEVRKISRLIRPHAPNAPEFVAQDVLRLSRRNEWVIRRALAQMMSGRDTTDELLPKLKMPVLFVWGTDDNIMPLDQGQHMQAITPHSSLAPIEGGGHLAPWEDPDQATPAILDFLR